MMRRATTGARLAAIAAGALLALPATATKGGPDMPDPERLLGSDPRFAAIVAEAERYKLQVLLGWIERDAGGGERLVQRGFRVDREYFYPASTIKLCAAIAALETLHRLPGGRVDATTPMTLAPRWPGEPAAETDPTHLAGGTITVGHQIRKLFLVSDNEAYNRLYDLVGADGITRSMRAAGLDSARISHRLEVRHTLRQHRTLPTVTFAGTPPTAVAGRLAPEPEPFPEMPGLDVGNGVWDGERVHTGPFDFRPKNRFSLVDLQRMLCKVVRPEADCGGGAGFDLTAADRALLMDAMATYPGDSRDPAYDRAAYPDHWVKFLLPGIERVVPKERIRILDKVGRAYGFSIENAWVERTGVEGAPGPDGFFLAAVFYSNADGVLNDDRYEYEEIADPFFADLGEAVARAVWGRAEAR